ncbi:MAG: TIGR01777 family oxidoreductase [Pseudomonadota bacterium]
MKVLITGGTGMVGSRLCERLSAEGHDLVVLTRNPKKSEKNASFAANFVQWDSLTEDWIAKEHTQGLNCVVNLAGEPLVEGRWTAEKKKRIDESRGKATQRLLQHLAKDGVNLDSFVSASAMGFYGNRGEEILTESASKGEGFLSDVCYEWEKPVHDLGASVASRTAILRISLVLGKDRGFLGEVLPIFKKGLGGNLATGEQWMSWIHEEDLVSLLVNSIFDPAYSGILNASAPDPCRNHEMTKALSKATGMPAVFPVPSFGLKLVFGDKAEMLLGSQRLKAQRMEELKFDYKHRNILESLKSLI